MRPHFEEKDQRLTVSVEKDLPDVEADADRIGQVLANLLTNANKYSPEGAQVRLVGPQGRRGGRVRGLGRRAGPRGGGARARLRPLLEGGERRDSGRGRHRPRPGDRQVAGRAARRSDLRELHPGRGRYLSVRASDRQGRPTDADGTHAQDEGGGCRVTRLLVADDSETVLLMLQRRLEMEGYEVVTATDGLEALERLREAGAQGARHDPARRDDAEHVGHRGPRGAAGQGVQGPDR